MHSRSSIAKITHLDETMDLSKSACEDFDRQGKDLAIENIFPANTSTSTLSYKKKENASMAQTLFDLFFIDVT